MYLTVMIDVKVASLKACSQHSEMKASMDGRGHAKDNI